MNHILNKKNQPKNFRISRPLNLTVHSRFCADSAVVQPFFYQLFVHISLCLGSSMLIDLKVQTSSSNANPQYSTYEISTTQSQYHLILVCIQRLQSRSHRLHKSYNILVAFLYLPVILSLFESLCSRRCSRRPFNCSAPYLVDPL